MSYKTSLILVFIGLGIGIFFWKRSPFSYFQKNATKNELCAFYGNQLYKAVYRSKAHASSHFFNQGSGGPEQIYAFDSNLQILCAFNEIEQAVSLRYEFNDFRLLHGSTADQSSFAVLDQFSVQDYQHHLFFDAKMDALTKHLIRDFLAKVQIHIKNETIWKIKEQDINSTYDVTYKRGKNSLLKSDYQYAEDPSGSVTKVTAESATKVLLSAKGKMQYLSGKLGTETTYGGNLIAQSLTTFSLSFDGEKSVKELTQERIKADKVTLTEADDFAASKASLAAERKMDESQIGSMTIEDLTSRLENVNAENSTDVFLKVRAFARVHPHKIEKLQSIIQNGTVADLKFRTLALGLSKAGMLEAERILLKAVESKSLDSKTEIYLVGLVGTGKNPTEELQKKLDDFISTETDHDKQQTLKLALANASRTSKDERPQLFSHYRQRAILDLNSSSSLQQKVDACHVVSNYGEEEILEGVSEFLSVEKHPLARSACISALRFVRSAKAEEYLRERLQQETDSSVQRAVAEELAWRDLQNETVEITRHFSRTTTDEATLSFLLRALARQLSRRPDLAQDLRSFATNSPSKEIRLLATNLLEQSHINTN